jgi:tripartite-type tricarboxylate transporter receptor subunit TctC
MTRVNDFAPITLIDRLANVLLINPALPVKNFAEFVKYVKANPGKWNYASSGNGSVAHLSMELLKSKLGIFVTHIPYRGAGPALNDLMSGQVHMTWNNLTSNLTMIQQGRLRALAVASPIRAPQLPDVPTFDELKLPDLNLTSWTGLAAPAKTPEPIITQLYDAMRTVLRDPQTQEAWRKRGRHGAREREARRVPPGDPAAHPVLPQRGEGEQHCSGVGPFGQGPSLAF